MLKSLLLLVLLVAYVAAQPACTLVVADTPNNKQYNYNLEAYKFPESDVSAFLTGYEAAAMSEFSINLCASASKSFSCTEPTPVCQKDQSGVANSCGTLATWTLSPWTGTEGLGGGVNAAITAGSQCPERQRQTNLYLKCDPSVTGKPPQAVITESQQCIYEIPISSSKFCPGAGGPSGGFDAGWIFVIIVLVGLFVYFVLGCVICKFGMHKEGAEVIPQSEFWLSLPGLVKDGIVFFFAKLTGPCRGGYTEV